MVNFLLELLHLWRHFSTQTEPDGLGWDPGLATYWLCDLTLNYYSGLVSSLYMRVVVRF